MKSLAALLTIGIGLVAACAPPDASRSDQVEAEIRAALESWAASLAAGDVEQSMTFVADDVVLVPPGEARAVGRDSVEAWTTRMVNSFTLDSVVVELSEVRAVGDWAVSTGDWVIRASVGGQEFENTSRFVVMWERQADGSWKVTYDIWNFRWPTG